MLAFKHRLSIAMLALVALTGCRAEARAAVGEDPPHPPVPDAQAIAAQSFTYDAWYRVLRQVDDRGRVDYQALADDPSSLNAFAVALANLAPETYEGWDEPDQIAFWINAYNALTLRAIIERWPLERSGLKAMMHPRGIRWIAGVWDQLEWTVSGRALTLDGIEHQTLRKDFVEPRIHAALVCAAVSCPPLRNEPFDGPYLDRQLDEQMRDWVTDGATGLHIDRDTGRVSLSKIFDWYGDDFVATDLPASGFGEHGDKVRATLAAAAKHLSDEDRAFLSDGHYRVGYLDYDWSLNEQLAP